MTEEHKPQLRFVEPGEMLETEPASEAAIESSEHILGKIEPAPPTVTDETKKVTDEFTGAMVRYIRTITDASTGTERTLAQLLRMLEMKFAEVKVFATMHELDSGAVTAKFKEAVCRGFGNTLSILAEFATKNDDVQLHNRLTENNRAAVAELAEASSAFREGSYIRESVQHWWGSLNSGMSVMWDYIVMFVNLGRAAGVDEKDIQMVLTGLVREFEHWNEYVKADNVTVNQHGLDIARKVSSKFDELVAAGLDSQGAVTAVIQWASKLPIDIEPDKVETVPAGDKEP